MIISRDGDRFVTGNLTAGEREGTNWMHEMGGSSAQVDHHLGDGDGNGDGVSFISILIIVESSSKRSACGGRPQEQALLQHQRRSVRFLLNPKQYLVLSLKKSIYHWQAGRFGLKKHSEGARAWDPILRGKPSQCWSFRLTLESVELTNQSPKNQVLREACGMSSLTSRCLDLPWKF